MRKQFLITALLFAVPVACVAQNKVRTETIHFAQGTSSKKISGTIKGYESVKYLVGLRPKQTMTVAFKPSSTSCYFNVSAPRAETAEYIGSSSGENSYTAHAISSGDYAVDVYLMRNAARRNETCNFTLTVGAQ